MNGLTTQEIYSGVLYKVQLWVAIVMAKFGVSVISLKLTCWISELYNNVTTVAAANTDSEVIATVGVMHGYSYHGCTVL